MGEKEQLGTASFAGEKFLGAVPLNVELMPKYRNRGFCTEIIRMMVNWVCMHFKRLDLYFVAMRENGDIFHYQG
ncbi:MAG: hypothetical protein K2I21_06540 [Acetatifactor sp.]|nr:hypothetical protein [Acetatifactor sp.]